MGYDLYSVVELCGMAGLAFGLCGFIAVLAGAHYARREFRTKGYLRPPSGRGWLRFLLWKQYDHFADPSARFLFGVAHFCLMGAIIVVMAVCVLLGSAVLLRGMAGFPTSLPEVSLPK